MTLVAAVAILWLMLFVFFCVAETVLISLLCACTSACFTRGVFIRMILICFVGSYILATIMILHGAWLHGTVIF